MRSPGWKILALAAFLGVAARAGDIALVVPPGGGAAARSAAEDLARYLQQMHPGDRLVLTDREPVAGRKILLRADGPQPDGYTVSHQGEGLAVIRGGGPRGLAFGIYALLEKLGCGFYLSCDTLPPARRDPLTFAEWSLEDRPLARERIVFDWHNFLSGCSSWNFEDWARWIDQSRKMRFDTVMVHAYGNNPMFTFACNGAAKPAGFLTSTVRGRDWGTEHVNDVRRLAGGSAFPGPVFGADAALAPVERRAEESQALMKRVFAHAGARGMHVCFALDVDTASANPQEAILTLPESARFRLTDGKTWLARPDTPEGYAYYKAQAQALFGLYPQIDRLVIWVRTGGTTWTDLKPEDLPRAWRKELADRLAADPDLAKRLHAAGRLGLGKVAAAFQRALKELGRDDVLVRMGSWNFAWMDEADPWTPPGLPFVSLDADVIHDQSHFDTPEKRAAIRAVARRRPVIPVVWAHHDDGQYIGRPFRPYDDFWSKLTDCGADSFGIIHWTTRPLDLYFKSLSEQVWSATSNRAVRLTGDDMGARLFGPASGPAGGEYLFAWIGGAPIFGRDTSDFFIDRPFPPERVDATVAGCRDRLAILDRIDAAALAPDARERLDYFRRLEKFCADFFQAEGRHQEAVALAQKGDREAARARLPPVAPDDVVEQYAALSSLGGITRGELGMLVTMNLKWLSYVEAVQQALGRAPVRMDFGPTSHEEAAQGAGRLTFHVDADSALWRVYGQRETGAEEFTIADPTRLQLPPGAPAGFAEIATTGVESASPLSLTVRPILDPRKGPPLGLEAGRYRLRLIFADPVSTASGERVFDVTVQPSAPAAPPVTFPPQKARFLRLVGRGSEENDWTSLYEIGCAARDPAGTVTASAEVAGFEALAAADGQPATRWAARGEGVWIQIPLKPDVAFDRVRLDWYEAASRQYRYDLLVSDDGATWRSVPRQGDLSAAPPLTATVDVVRDAGGPGRVRVKDFDVTLGAPGTVRVTLTPKAGKALIAGAVLEPLAPAP